MVLVLIGVCFGGNAGKDVMYQKRIGLVFQQLFAPNVTCAQWASNNFEEEGAWYHPNLPEGAVGWSQIQSFCEDTRFSFPQSVYLPTVLPQLTHSGDYAFASVDYVFSSNQPTSPFSNWGNVFFALNDDYIIHYAVETWTRRVWPAQL